MTPEERIDAALDSILKITGCAKMGYYKDMLPNHAEKMREAMRKIMGDSYIHGANDALDAITGKDKK